MASAKAERARLGRTPLYAELPAGFTADEEGQWENQDGVTVMAQRLVGGLADNLEYFSPESLGTEGYTLVEAGPLPRNDLSGKLFVLDSDKGRTLAALLEKGRETALVLATAPKKVSEDQLLRSMVDSLSWEDRDWFDPYLGLPFSLDDPPGLRFVRRDGPVVLYSETGRYPDPGRAVFLATREEADGGTAEERVLRRLRGLGLVQNPQVDGPHTVSGKDWQGAWATAQPEPEKGGPNLFMAIVPDGNWQITLTAQCPAKECLDGLVKLLPSLRLRREKD